MFAEVVAEVQEADDRGLLAELCRLEERRREDAAREALVLAELERRKAYARDAHASMWGLLRCTVGWSDAECRTRMRVARLVDEHRCVAEELFDSRVSVANVAEMARAFANPRCGDQIDEVLGTLLTNAGRLEFDDFKLVVRRWEKLADVDGSHRDAAADHEHRNAHCVVWDGAGHLAAQWGELDGIANREIFDRYVATEWQADWDATVAAHGDRAAAHLMPRTDAQRRADALTRIFSDAASREPGSRAPEPVVNIHLDHDSFRDLMIEANLFPERVRDPFDDRGVLVTERRCHTANGDPIDPATVLQVALEGHVRYVIHDDTGIPIRWGRKRRLFHGAARAAVMSLATRCTHPGCRVRTGRTQADHSTDFAAGGVTDPANGNPRCAKHNRLKNQGYTTWRDLHGNWHTHRPDGSEIC